MKCWVENFYEIDFKENEKLEKMFTKFIENTMITGSSSLGSVLSNSLLKKQNPQIDFPSSLNLSPAPNPRLSMRSDFSSIQSVNASEVFIFLFLFILLFVYFFFIYFIYFFIIIIIIIIFVYFFVNKFILIILFICLFLFYFCIKRIKIKK